MPSCYRLIVSTFVSCMLLEVACLFVVRVCINVVRLLCVARGESSAASTLSIVESRLERLLKLPYRPGQFRLNFIFRQR